VRTFSKHDTHKTTILTAQEIAARVTMPSLSVWWL